MYVEADAPCFPPHYWRQSVGTDNSRVRKEATGLLPPQDRKQEVGLVTCVAFLACKCHPVMLLRQTGMATVGRARHSLQQQSAALACCMQLHDGWPPPSYRFW